MKRIIIDYEKCNGCKNCVIACMQAHRSDKGTLYDLELTDISNESRVFVTRGKEQDSYIPLICRHCDEPECVISCMSGALQKNEDNGYVLYDDEKCGVCFMCVMNCPYGNIKPDNKTQSKVIKCDFCAGDGYEPNCVKNCPNKAIYVEEV